MFVTIRNKTDTKKYFFCYRNRYKEIDFKGDYLNVKINKLSLYYFKKIKIIIKNHHLVT